MLADGLDVDAVGGGVSQVATTLFNAAFFAGFALDEHTAQILGYLRACRIEHGLLINFGSPVLQVKKYALSEPGLETRS